MGDVMAKYQCLLTENGVHLVFRDQWARNILNEIMRTEKKMIMAIATALKIPVTPGLLKKEKFTFQRKIQELVTWHRIPKKLINSFHQMPLSYITVGNTTPELSGVQPVPVKGKGKEKSITGTFSITAAGNSLPMQLIYVVKTQHCHPKGIPLAYRFDVIHSKNH